MVASASVPIESVPANPACSPLAPMAIVGPSKSAGRSSTTEIATASAINVSVPSGRCGPCCSVEPTGTTSTRRSWAAISTHVASASRSGATLSGRCGPGLGLSGRAPGQGEVSPGPRSAPTPRAQAHTLGQAHRAEGQ